jgi:hypothetical protein
MLPQRVSTQNAALDTKYHADVSAFLYVAVRPRAAMRRTRGERTFDGATDPTQPVRVYAIYRSE